MHASGAPGGGMNRAAPRIGILQTGRAPAALRDRYGDYDAMCANLVGAGRASARTFAVLDGELPSDPDDCDAWVITGSRHGVHDGFAWIADLSLFLRQAHARRRKIVGLCFGHQILAEALDGSVRKHSGGPGIGIMEYGVELAAGPKRVSLPSWHFDQVHVAPANARLLARSDFCPYAGLAYGDHAISFQAHPEFSKDYLTALVDHYDGRELDAERANAARATLARPINAEVIRTFVRDFIAS